MINMMHHPYIRIFSLLSPNFTSIYVIIIETCPFLSLAGKTNSDNVFILPNYHVSKVD